MNSCFAIICWGDKVLLFLRDDIPTIPFPDHWHLPGGGIEMGETPREAIERELEEEITHVPKKLELLERFTKKDGFETHIYYSFVDEDESKLFKHRKEEGQEIRFFTLDEMANLKLTPRIKHYLTDYGKELENALKRKSFDSAMFSRKIRKSV